MRHRAGWLVILLLLPQFGGDYELIWPFLEGLLAAADSRMRIIDGNEDGYNARHIDEFRDLVNRTAGAKLPTPELTKKYPHHIVSGVGVWLERNGWSDQPETRNITPAHWEVKLRDAIRLADPQLVGSKRLHPHRPSRLPGRHPPGQPTVFRHSVLSNPPREYLLAIVELSEFRKVCRS
jgi:hypothetical protein